MDQDRDIKILSEEEIVDLLTNDEEFAARFVETLEECIRRMEEEDIVD